MFPKITTREAILLVCFFFDGLSTFRRSNDDTEYGWRPGLVSGQEQQNDNVERLNPMEGTSITLQCGLTGPGDYKISWMYSTEFTSYEWVRLPTQRAAKFESELRGGYYEVLDDTPWFRCDGPYECEETVTIFHLNVGDSGSYRCERTERSQPVQVFKDFSVNVLRPPMLFFRVGDEVYNNNSVLLLSMSSTEEDDGEAVVSCVSEDGHPGATLSWSSKSLAIPGAREEGRHTMAGSLPTTQTSTTSLALPIDRNTDVNVRCDVAFTDWEHHPSFSPTHLVGRATTAAPPRGQVLFKLLNHQPTEAIKGDPVFEVEIGAIVLFKCMPELDWGSPEGRISILQNGKKVKHQPFTTSDELGADTKGKVILTITDESQSGIYTCNIKNKVVALSSRDVKYILKVKKTARPPLLRGRAGPALPPPPPEEKTVEEIETPNAPEKDDEKESDDVTGYLARSGRGHSGATRRELSWTGLVCWSVTALAALFIL